MEVIKTDIADVLIIKPIVREDARGCFFESYSQREFDEKVGPVRFVQDNESHSSFGVARGLHFQVGEYAQAKLVRVTEGTVLDVAVDIRKSSPTYGKYVAVELSAENHLQLFIPRGFAHGFSVLSPKVTFQYKCDNFYAPGFEGGIKITDPTLNIDWRIASEKIILSPKDTLHPLFEDFESPFE